MASPRYTVRLPSALDALVQARVRAGTPFAVLIREALAAYLADTPPTRADTPADSLRVLQEALDTLIRRVDTLEQLPTARRQLADSRRQLAADTPPTGADTRRQPPADTAPTGADTQPPPYDPTRYFLGVLCPRGHDYAGTGQSVRKRSNHSCQRCDVEQKRARRQRLRERTRGDEVT
jgi:hypothetical protein